MADAIGEVWAKLSGAVAERQWLIADVEGWQPPGGLAAPLALTMRKVLQDALEYGNLDGQRELGSTTYAITNEAEVLAWIDAHAQEFAGGILDDRMIAVLKRLLLDGLANDLPVQQIIAQAQAQLAPLLDTTDGRIPAQVATIVRTMLTKAYNQGRRAFFEDERLGSYVQGYMWSAVLDDRTTEFCRRMDGKKFRIDDPIWQTLGAPPAHWNCRSLLVPIVMGQQWTPSKYPKGVEPAPGFGAMPE